jgi:hypothetical protein
VSLSNDGKALAIGAPQGWGEGPGYVNVYGLNDDGSSWNALGPSINDVGSGRLFGWSTSLSGHGKVLAVGDPTDSANGYQSGKVNIFQWDEDALYFKPLGQSISGELFDEKVGESVALSGDGNTLAVGALSGQVNVYGWDETDLDYKQIEQAINGEFLFGRTMALSNDGKTVAIGAAGDYDPECNGGHGARLSPISFCPPLPATLAQCLLTVERCWSLANSGLAHTVLSFQVPDGQHMVGITSSTQITILILRCICAVFQT